MDSLVWKAPVMPKGDNLESGNITEDVLERMFAEDALEHLHKEDVLHTLTKGICPEDKDGNTLSDGAAMRAVRSMVKRWSMMRNIDKEYQQAVRIALAEEGIIPNIVNLGLVEDEWFIA